jgi:nitrite reductase/ring-hydroxylating ferredoxin subunit
MEWTPAFPLSKLPAGGSKVFKHNKTQVAVFRLDDDELYAVDNRCPHEGYPLCQGQISGTTLTCCWHNYKFDLKDGACIQGEENVRTFPVRVQGEVVELCITPPDPKAEIHATWKSLEAGLEEYQMGRVARDIARLLNLGVAPSEIALRGAVIDCDRGKYGPGHGLAVLADVLRWSGRFEGIRAAVPLTQAMDMVGRATVRRPVRSIPTPVDPGTDPEAAFVRIRAHVEAEAHVPAEALVRGGIPRFGVDTVYGWLARLCADHHLGFGHRLIYLTKVQDLLRAAPPEAATACAPAILGALTFGIVNGTREDMLPPWATFSKRLNALGDDLPRYWKTVNRKGQGVLDELLASILDGTTAQMTDALVQALEDGAPIGCLLDTLNASAAQRMLRFDPKIDGRLDVQENWLWVTHNMTYCRAVRQACRHFDHPDLIRLIFFAAKFVNQNRPLDLPAAQRPMIAIDNGGPDLATALQHQDIEGALAAAAALANGGPERKDALVNQLMDLCMNEPAVTPIVVAHVIKNTICALDEWSVTGDVTPVLAVVKLLAAPPRERQVLQRTQEGIAFVNHGKIPRTLTG